MTNSHLIFNEPHKELLLFTDQGRYTVTPDYTPALELIQEGFCNWKDGNPGTFRLELTAKGLSAVAYLKNPNPTAGYFTEEVSETLHRLMDGDKMLGFVIKQDDGRWMAYDDRCTPFQSETYASPASALLGFKMFDAQLDAHFAELDISEMRT